MVDSDLRPEQLGCVLVEVGSFSRGSFEPWASSPSFRVGSGADQVELPLSFGVVRPRGGDARVELRAHALPSCDDPDTRTVTQRLRTGFVEGHRLRVPMFLSARCIDVICGEDETCDAGACVPTPTLDPETLVEVGAPGSELLDVGVRDAGAGPDAARPPLPSDVVPGWAFSSDTTRTFEATDAVAFDGASGDAFVSASIAPTSIDVGAETFSGSGIVMARIARDGTVRWARQWTSPMADLWLQRIGVSAITSTPTGLYACGSMGEDTKASLTDPETMTTWSSRVRGDPRIDHTDAWLARLDPATGHLLALSTIVMPPPGADGSTSCRAIVELSDGRLLVVAQYYNFVTPEPTSLWFDGVDIPIAGVLPSRPRVALLRVRVGASSFTADDVRFGAADDVLVLPRAGQGPLLLVSGLPAPSGFLAGEPAPGSGVRETAALVGLDALGAPERFVPVAQTSDGIQSLSAVVSPTGVWVQASLFESLVDGVTWGELVGGTRRSDFAAYDALVGRFDPGTLALAEELPVNPFDDASLAAVDRDGNLYLVAGLTPGARAPGLTAPYSPTGATDIYLASLTPSRTVRWHHELTETMGETTYRDTLSRVVLAVDGAILVTGQTSASGIAFGSSQAHGVFTGLFVPGP